MKYIGSGYLSSLFSEQQIYDETNDVIVIGRRIFRMRVNDFKYIFNKDCIFLDTVDSYSLKKFSYKWFFNIYRLEKAFTYSILKIFCKKIKRVHVPLIADSDAWKKLISASDGILISGFSYKSLYKILEKISSEKKNIYRSSDLYRLSLDLNIKLDSIKVMDCFHSRLVESVKKT